MTLVDGNLFIALVVTDHAHHAAARRWRMSHDDEFVTTPITQGTLLRFLVRGGMSGPEAVAAMLAFLSDLAHEFWPDDREFDSTVMRNVVGHRQVTDAYLAALARHRGGRLATFDAGLAATFPDVVDLVPT